MGQGSTFRDRFGTANTFWDRTAHFGTRGVSLSQNSIFQVERHQPALPVKPILPE